MILTKDDIAVLDKVAVRFTAEWCSPCKVFAPTFEKVAEEYKEDVSSMVINVGTSEGQDLAQAYGIHGIPAVAFLQKGQVSHLMIGNQSLETTKSEFEKLKNV